MDVLQSLLETYNIPIVSAFILGLMTAISPCPLATNITATAFIYTAIGLILYFGASKFHIARFFNQNGEKFLGPLLIIIGLIMLNSIKLNFLGKSNFQEKFSEKFKDKGVLGSFLIGVVFALAFCPYSGAIFFGMLIPMTIASSDGLYLSIVFAFGTGLPVILFTYLLAFTAGKVGVFYNRITKIEKVMRTVAGVVFILTGLYYVFIFTGILK